MKDFGQHLVRAREAAGLSVDDIHQRTRISRKNLQLLEAGDFPSIPQTYIRAFVREYARIVGLDEEDTLALYNELAERDRGVPPPPSAIDSSNLLPRNDDSVEFLPASNRSTSHVEVSGTAEAVDDEFVPNIRKSSYVSDDGATPIEIRTSFPTSRKSKESRLTDTAPPTHEAKTPAPLPATPQAAATAATIPAQPVSKVSPASEPLPPHDPAPPVRQEKDKEIVGSGTAVQPPQAAPPQQPLKTTKTKDSGGAGKDKPARPSVYDTKPPIEEAWRAAETKSDKSQDRRIIGIGLVVIAMIAVAVYGIYFFSFRSESDESSIDSTAIKASIEAGRFIDSTQAALTDIELPPDTIPIEANTPPEPVETKPKVYARDDSLVLEAFTNSPVWFSVKMDTLRTERGSLSSNEHRVWKARDFFVVTLGDAGAVTFFLNGKEIGTLGDEGSVVKNVVLSRSRTKGD